MTKDEFLNLLNEAQMNLKEFAKEIGYSYESVEDYKNGKTIPKSIQNILLWIVNVKKFQKEIINPVHLQEKISELKTQNNELLKELHYLEFMKNELLKTIV